MTCEKAEEFLSAYLDDMLDLRHRREVEAHLQNCVGCRAVLDDYRRFDMLLGREPRVVPPEDLYTRIVESPEFVAITQSRERGGVLTLPRPLTRVAPVAQPAAAISSDESPGHSRARDTRGAPGVARVALQIAAVVALLLGSALLVKQGFFHSGTTSGQSVTQTYGAPPQNAGPLSAGARVVYEHDGALWSAPAVGPGVAQRLTPAGVRTGGWSVSPNGGQVAYVDQHSGRLLVIRSDGQDNREVAQVVSGSVASTYWTTAAGKAIALNIAWAPNGDRIAYLSGNRAGSMTSLHVVNADGSNDVLVDTGASAVVAQLTWSGDGLQVAYTQIANDAQAVATYNTVTRQVSVLAPRADAADALARVDQLVWLADTVTPALTWATREGSAYTGIFSSPSPQHGDVVTRLTPAGMRFAAVAFTPRHSGGAWAVAPFADNPALSIISVREPGLLQQASPRGEVRSLDWSPSGDTVAFVTAEGQLSLWSPWSASAQQTVAVTGLDAIVGHPAWSPNAARLAVPTLSGVVVLRISTGGANEVAARIEGSGTVSLVWATDSQTLALAGTSGVSLASGDGTAAKVVDAHAMQNGQLTWTVAG